MNFNCITQLIKTLGASVSVSYVEDKNNEDNFLSKMLKIRLRNAFTIFHCTAGGTVDSAMSVGASQLILHHC